MTGDIPIPDCADGGDEGEKDLSVDRRANPDACDVRVRRDGAVGHCVVQQSQLVWNKGKSEEMMPRVVCPT